MEKANQKKRRNLKAFLQKRRLCQRVNLSSQRRTKEGASDCFHDARIEKKKKGE